MTVTPIRLRKPTAAVGTAIATPCINDPDRWIGGDKDPEPKALCRFACPRRRQCAKEALKTPAAYGVWAGVFIPTEGRRRKLAMRQLRAVAAHSSHNNGSERV